MEKKNKAAIIKKTFAVLAAAVFVTGSALLFALVRRSTAPERSAKGSRELLERVGYADDDYHAAVFGNRRYSCRQVVSVEFHDTLDDMPLFGCWDASVVHKDAITGGVSYGRGGPRWRRDGSVYAWMKRSGDGYALHIAANGGVKASLFSDVLFADYVNLREIRFNGAFDVSGVRYMDRMFLNCRSLKTVVLPEAEEMFCVTAGMFMGCTALEEIDFSGVGLLYIDRTASQMFASCGSLQNLDLRCLRTDGAEDLSEMFRDCSALRSLDLSRFETGAVTDMHGMFAGCSSCERFDLSAFTDRSLENADGMFEGTTGEVLFDPQRFLYASAVGKNAGGSTV